MHRLLFMSLWLAVVNPAYGGWREATTEKFIVYSDGREKQLIDFTQRVEKFDQVLRIMTGLKVSPSPVRFRIYLVSGAQAVQGLMPRPRPNVQGFYETSMSGGIGVLNRDRAPNAYGLGETILYHEYCHHFMHQYFPTAYPIWYQEGFAEYFSTTAITRDDIVEVGRIALHRVPTLFNEAWLKAAVLMEGTLDKLPSDEWDQFYAQSWLLTHYLFSDKTRQPYVRTYLELHNNGMLHSEALQKAFELTDGELESELRKYFSKGQIPLIRLSGTQFGTPKISVRELSQAESIFLLPSLRLELGVKEEAQKRLFAQIRKLAATLPDDRHAQGALAAAEARYGDQTAAMNMLEKLTEIDPKNRRALLDLAHLYLMSHQPDEALRRAADRKARNAAVKANRLMPEDPEALVLFYKSFRADESGPTENAVDALTRAHENLPQNDETTWLLAAEALRRKESKYAITLLKPIAYSPHGGANATNAQKWIHAIEAHQEPGLPSEFDAAANFSPVRFR